MKSLRNLLDRARDLGVINIANRKLSTVRVNAYGSWTRQVFHPARGQMMLVIGNTTGTIINTIEDIKVITTTLPADRQNNLLKTVTQ